MEKTIELACRVEPNRSAGGGFYDIVCPVVMDEGTVVSASLSFSAPDKGTGGHYALSVDGIGGSHAASRAGEGKFIADLGWAFLPFRRGSEARIALAWVPYAKGRASDSREPAKPSGASLSLRLSSSQPFTPIASLSCADGSSLSIGALDGRELYSKPVFRNVFAYPLFLHYDSAIAGSSSHISLPKGVRLSFLESFDGQTWLRGSGEGIPFSAAVGSSDVLVDPRGTGLYAKREDGLWAIVDAFDGSRREFDSSGYLVRVADGFGNALLQVSRTMLGATATDRLGNSVALTSNKLSLNGGTHELILSVSSGYLSSATYRKGSSDAGETTHFSCGSQGMSEARTAGGEVLRAGFSLSGAPTWVAKGVMQGTSFVAEERLDVSYDYRRAAAKSMRGLSSDLTFDASGRVETRGDGSGMLRQIFPGEDRTFAGFAPSEYVRKTLSDYPVAMYYESGSFTLQQGQVPLLSGGSMLPGRRYCVSATVDFTGSTPPSGSSTFVMHANLSGPSMTVTLDFSQASGWVRTAYAFFEVPSAAGLLEAVFQYSNMPGTATVESVSVVACSFDEFCYESSSGAIGPHFGTRWAKRTASNSFGLRYSSGFVDGYVTKADAAANALLSIRGQSLFFHDGLTALRCGSFGYGTSFPKAAPSSASVGFRSVSEPGAESLERVKGLSSSLEIAASRFDGSVEAIESETVGAFGQALSSSSPLGGSESQYDSSGRLASEREKSASGTYGDQVSYGYSGTDPRPASVVGPWADVTPSYAGSTLNVSALSGSPSSWGGDEYYGYGTRDESRASLSVGSSSASASHAGGRTAALAQGAGSLGFAYGLGGLRVLSASDGTCLESRSASFGASSTWRRKAFGSNGSVRIEYSEYSRPKAAYLAPASGSESKIASWDYGYTDSDGEYASSPLRAFSDLLSGTADAHSIDGDARTETVQRSCPSDGRRAGSFASSWDELGRASSLSAGLAGRGLFQLCSASYAAGTSAPASFSGSLKDWLLTFQTSGSVSYDGFGRPSSASASFDGKSVSRSASYVHGLPSTLSTACSWGGGGCSSSESIARDGRGRISSATLSEGGSSYLLRIQRDAEGRISREDNKALGKTFLYHYDASGGISSVEEGDYTTWQTPTITSTRTFAHSSSWGALLVGAGSAISNSSGYPTSIQGNFLSWEAGRLKAYGSSSFSYDALGNLISRSGGGRQSAFLYDPSGRLLEEVSSSYSIAFVYGISGIVGFRVRSGSAAGNYVYRFDALGNVDAIVGSSGIVARYAYDAFGNGVVMNPDRTANASAAFVGNINPIRYKGGLFDKETGLYKFGSRWYAPFLYQWLSPDAAEYLGVDRIGGPNPYVFCNNDPATYSDSDGRLAISTALFLGLVGASFAIGFTASVVSQGFNYGWENINGYTFLQASIDGFFAAASTAFAYTGIGLAASMVIGGAMGFAQYSIDSAFHDDFTWSGAVMATGLGVLGGAISGRGAQHYVSIGNNLDEVGRSATSALLTAFDRYGYGVAYDATINLWGSRLASSLAKSYAQTFVHAFRNIAIYTPLSYTISSVYSRWGWNW